MTGEIVTHYHMGYDRRYCGDCVEEVSAPLGFAPSELDDHTIASGFCPDCGSAFEEHEIVAAQERIAEDRRRDAE